jgi:hypothetical protein
MSNGESSESARDWTLEQEFLDDGGQPIQCDKPTCDLGSYCLRVTSYIREDGSRATAEELSPGCTQCGYAGALLDAFRPTESGDAPPISDDFRVGAARVLAATASEMLGVLAMFRPDTVAKIQAYAARGSADQ